MAGPRQRVLAALALCLLLVACARQRPIAPSAEPTVPVAAGTYVPTVDDGVSPSYRPGSPVRGSVGRGHVLTGTVVSSATGLPIDGARLELWPEYAGKGHPDEARATVLTDAQGRYWFECNPPEHIHMRISAEGFVTIGQNSYHPGDATAGTFDIALRPKSP